MKRFNGVLISVFAILAVLLLTSVNVMASEEAGNWRHTYDIIMKWVNFSILAFVIVKFGKKPLSNFLKGRSEELSEEIKSAEDQRDKAVADVEALKQTVGDKKTRLDEIKQRLSSRAEQNKASMIEQAQTHAKQLIQDAKHRISFQIAQARSAFQAELVDMAFELATKGLQTKISDKDTELMMQQYIKNVENIAANK